MSAKHTLRIDPRVYVLNHVCVKPRAVTDLLLCPVDTGPYLRMALNEQVTSCDSVMSSGRAPDGALTVAAEALSKDDEYPQGFYLRVVDGQAWLRGYRCDGEHTWSPDDRFIFQLPPLPA
jgi:hypothetical protein